MKNSVIISYDAANSTTAFTVMPDPRLYYAASCSNLTFTSDSLPSFETFREVMDNFPGCSFLVVDKHEYLDMGAPIDESNSNS